MGDGPAGPYEVSPSSSRMVIRKPFPLVEVLFCSAFLVAHLTLIPTFGRLPGGWHDPHSPTILGWLMSVAVSSGLAVLIHFAWLMREDKGWGAAKRLGYGLASFVMVFSIAFLAILAIRWILMRWGNWSDPSPALQAVLLTVGVHLLGMIIWLPIHLILWCIPWRNQPGPT